MQFEEFDKKVKDAANHHHPAYDEQAWVKMEKLLNVHLPQKEDDRRRIFFILFFFLLLGGGAWIILVKPWQGNKPLAKQVSLKDQTNTNPASNNSSSGQKDLVNDTRVNSNNVTEPNKNSDNISQPLPSTNTDNNNDKSKVNYSRIIKYGVAKDPLSKSFTDPKNINGTDNISNSIPGQKEGIIQPKNEAKDNAIVNVESKPESLQKNPTVQQQPVINTNGNSIVKTENNKITEPVKQENTTTTKSSAKTNQKKRNTFFFTLSAGPDVSSAGSDKLGKMKLLGGIGLGYTFKDRLTVRSGFYTGRKVYTATPNEYNPPAIFWAYYPNLQKVDANCKVYEIPLSISYNFGHSAKQNWFASTGISSLLMKEETYNYTFKNSSGQVQNREWTIRNENKHYFSILTLSGGYQRNISKTISLTVEPYAKIPLTGVGYGKVKLNSFGVLFSAAVKPFGHSKKVSSH
jgi:hypothetical protein